MGDEVKSADVDQKYKVYKWLIGSKKCWIVDGHKFGADFLLYQSNPDIHHATHLIFIK